MLLRRPPLEAWFNEHHPGVRHDLGGTMVPFPEGLARELARPGHFDVRYGATDGSAQLRALLAAEEGLAPEDFVLTCGASEANAAVLLAAVRPGATVLLQSPIYYQFEGLLEGLGARIRRWPLDAAFDPAWGREDVCLVILNSPHNPTGTVTDPRTALAALRPGTVVLVDEVYRGVSADGLATAAALGAVVTNSLAKRWALPGLRLGWLATRDHAFRETALAWHEHLASSAPRPSERFVAELFPEIKRAMAEGPAIAARNADTLASWLPSVAGKLRGALPQAGVTTLLWLEGRTDDVAFALRLRERDCFVLPGSFVGYPGAIRIGFGHRDEGALRAALGVLGDA